MNETSHYSSPSTGETSTFVLQVIPEEISFLVTIFHSYGHIAVVRTLDAVKGKIQISVAPGFEGDFYNIFNSLRNDLFMTIISVPEQKQILNNDNKSVKRKQ